MFFIEKTIYDLLIKSKSFSFASLPLKDLESIFYIKS